jgi:hypothetical protein
MRPRPARPVLAARTAGTVRTVRSLQTVRHVAALAVLPLALAACGDDRTAVEDLPASAPLTADATQDADPSTSPVATAPPVEEADEPAAASPAAPAPQGPVAVSDLRVGTCFDDVDAGLNEVSEVPAVPCDRPHANEVFAVLEQPGDEFPGEEEIRGLAEEGCSASFESYVGAPFETSTLTPFPVTPTAASWAKGDRQVVCVLTSPEPRTASARGSGA